MNPFEYSISFRVRHSIIDPDEITNQLKLQPHTKRMCGQRRQTPHGDLLEGFYTFTGWSVNLIQAKSTNLELEEFLEQKTEEFFVHKQFLNTLVATGGQIDYFIGWFSGFNSGAVFSYKLLQKMGELGVDLSLDMYSMEGKSSEEDESEQDEDE